VLEVVVYGLACAAVAAFLLLPGYVLVRGVRPQWGTLLAACVAPLLAMAVAGATTAIGLVLPWSQRVTASAVVVVVIAATVVGGVRRRARLAPDRDTIFAVGVWLLLLGAVVAFVAIPSRPQFHPGSWAMAPERVETPRLSGFPSDSHLPYRTAQLARLKDGGEALRGGYHPGWWISDRTPLAGLTFSFAGAVGGIDVPNEDLITLPDSQDTMELVDPYGYWLYLVVSAAEGTAGVLAVYLLGLRWFGRRAARLGSLLFCVMPGVFLYAIYPRPALVLVLPALVALALADIGHRWWAGATVGLCYLLHPTGAVWGLAVVALLWSGRAHLRQWAGDVGRVLVPAAVVAVPWLTFTSSVVGGSPRMTTWPLGSTLSDPRQPLDGIREAWDALLDRGLWTVLWVRASALERSIVPIELMNETQLLAVDYRNLHALAAWGLTGLVLFPLGVVALALVPGAGRRRVALIAAVVVSANIVIEGRAESFVPQSLLPLLALLGVVLAAWMARWSRPWRLVVVGAALVELALMIWTPSLYVPFGIDTGPRLALVGASVACQLAVVGILARELWSAPREERGREAVAADVDGSGAERREHERSWSGH
jgi:hypothetical protein